MTPGAALRGGANLVLRHVTGVSIMLVSFFKDEKAKSITTRELTLAELRTLILSTTAERKSSLPWLKCARFGSRRTDAGSLRHNANVEGITGIEVDYDGEKIAVEIAAKVLRRAKLNALVYTSPSHSKDRPRWRVLAPTSRELPPGERVRLVGGLDALLGGLFARESFTLSQAYYFGSINRNHDHRCIIVKGQCIDLAKLPKANYAPRHHSRGQHRSVKRADPFEEYGAAHTFVAPIDVERRLAEMQYRGPGETGIHLTQLSTTAALLVRGWRVEDVVVRVLQATREAAGPAGRSWSWRVEARGLRDMCRSWLDKHPQRVCVEVMGRMVELYEG
jgi:hypothetical protein